MNKKKLYNSIMESISKELQNIILFNNSNIFDKEESYYDKSNIVDNYTYKTIDYKILNDIPISEEESLYYFKIKQEFPIIILRKLKRAEKVSNEILKGLSVNKIKYRFSTREKIEKIIDLYNKRNPEGSLNWIDTSNITDMSELFQDTDYNGDISEWDTSNVIDMSYMFLGAEKFNQPIGNWDVSNVKDMSYMFENAKLFNQPIGDWDIRNVTNMDSMFYEAESFNQPIGNWNFNNIINMSHMFERAKAFNQDLSKWNLSIRINTYNIFEFCPIKEEYKPKNIE